MNETHNQKVVPHQSDKWDAAVASMPAMKCGRLDMETWSGDGEHMQRFVYIEGVEERTLVQGPFCDHIAYAAQSYARVLARATAAEERVRVLEEALTRHKHTDECLAYAASTGKSFCIAPCMDARTALSREGEKA